MIDDQNRFVYGPSAVYVARGPESHEVIGPYAAPADLLVTEPAYRSKQAATEEDPFAAVYQADGVEFERTRAVAGHGRQRRSTASWSPRPRRSGRQDSPVPDVGEKAPVVETDTAAECAGPSSLIDTREPPAPSCTRRSFKDVVGKKPVALLFATPQLCQSRVCGPVVDIALQLKQKYGDRVEFIHQEVYVDNDAEKGLREPLRRSACRPSRGCSPSARTGGRGAAGGLLRPGRLRERGPGRDRGRLSAGRALKRPLSQE